MNLRVESEQDDAPDMEETFAFSSRRGDLSETGALQNEEANRCKALLDALDRLPTMEERIDRFMTDILETGGFWKAGGPGEVPPGMALVEVQVHGISALGREIGQAIANWIAAARRRMDGQGGDL